jgi:hypothetical protein
MNLSNLAERAKRLIAKRGGVESVKEDALEVKEIVTGEGSLTEKTKEAIEALKVPGADSTPAGPAPTPKP